ncbi:uncharacterized protein ACA1_121290 [Acanthamoeba castellanii str. Neff]|uniref:Uncharacterized protein n=1 Tax=Acanthamoeba castellanii (strain ATCC 30010 / Neff) TaxID=1257118 RepID=L8GEH7_ACACF|nr:uncharacterized protein ACA1_121290 [Acanthamoeba castellanii str. Neff]ELR11432.1 hypothetical protein ACA1_121290 [Acanthamoeba castellanii str. Neff]
MRRKPVNRRFLRDQRTNYPATHAALDSTQCLDTGRMSNFLHKARYGALPVRAVRHHFYWRRTPGGPAPIPVPAAAATDANRKVKWLARQLVYQSQLCPASNADIATRTAQQVQSLVLAAATTADPVVTDIPLWFHAGSAAHELRPYAPDLGTLGYVPNALRYALDYCGVTDKNTLIQNIAVTIAKGAHSIWLARCKALVDSNAWKTAHDSAKSQVEAGA